MYLWSYQAGLPTRRGVEQSGNKPLILRLALAPGDDDDDDHDHDDDHDNDNDDDHDNDDDDWLCQRGPSGLQGGTSPCQGGALGPEAGIGFDESPGNDGDYHDDDD